MSKLISKESLTAYERWELPNVSEEEEPDEAAGEDLSPDPASFLTVEQIEAIQQEAHQEAYKAGFEQGHREGYEAGQSEVHAAVQRLEQVLHALSEPLLELSEEVEGELVELALAVARQVIRRELKIDPGQIVSVMREAIAVLPSSARDIRVYLHPDDAALVRETLAVREGNEEHHWRIVDEPVLTRGGCRVVAENSRVDATLEKQIAAIVTEVLGGERAGDHIPDS